MPPQSDDKVWISREEYERLRQAEQVQPSYVTPTLATPVVPAAPPDTLNIMQRQQLTVGAVLGIGFVLSLCVSALHWLAGTIAAVFLIFAITSMVQYQRTKQKIARGDVPKPPRSTTSVLLIITGGILLLPIVFFGGMIILFLIIMGLNGGQVGS